MLRIVNHSFAAKLNFYLLSLLIALFIIGFGIFYHFAFLHIEKNAYQKITQQAKETNLRVSNLLRTIEKIPENMSWMLPIYVTQPDSIFNVTRQVVQNNDEIFGCAIAFEPHYFPSKGKHFAPYSYTSGNQIVTTQISNSYDYYAKQWYKISKDRNTSCWSPPYHEQSSYNIITSTYSVPLRTRQGKVIGIFSVDLSLNWLTTLIDSIKPFPDSYIIIVNRDGKYILRRNGAFQPGKEESIYSMAIQRQDTTLLAIAHRLTNGESGKAIFLDHNDKAYIFYSPILGTEWCMATICPYEHIYEGLHRFNFIILFSFLFFLFFICLVSSTTIRKITHPLKVFALSAHSISNGNFKSPLPPVSSDDEMKELHDAFSEMQEKLTKYMNNLEKTIAAKEKIESELRIAHDIQMSLLRKKFPPFPEREEIDLYAVLYPARQVGGDLYDFFIIQDHLYFAIGDVSGKGIPASLLMTSTITLLRSLSMDHNSPSQITCLLNNSIAQRNETNMFVTFFIGMLNLKTGEMKYCNAGHTPPIITYPDKNVSFCHLKADLPLGILENYRYPEYSYRFTSGSGILLYTDGVTDAENKRGEFYTRDRLLNIVKQNKSSHPRTFIGKIVSDIRKYTQGAEQTDDLTLFTFIYGTEWKTEEHT